MSISRNVGSMARYLAEIRMKPGYIKIKERVEAILNISLWLEGISGIFAVVEIRFKEYDL